MSVNPFSNRTLLSGCNFIIGRPKNMPLPAITPLSFASRRQIGLKRGREKLSRILSQRKKIKGAGLCHKAWRALPSFFFKATLSTAFAPSPKHANSFFARLETSEMPLPCLQHPITDSKMADSVKVPDPAWRHCGRYPHPIAQES